MKKDEVEGVEEEVWMNSFSNKECASKKNGSFIWYSDKKHNDLEIIIIV